MFTTGIDLIMELVCSFSGALVVLVELVSIFVTHARTHARKHARTHAHKQSNRHHVSLLSVRSLSGFASQLRCEIDLEGVENGT